MLEEVIEIISKYQGIEASTINENSNLISDLELSSFDVISLACEFEDRFNIEIPDRKIKNLVTIKDIVEFIKQNQ